MTEAAKIRQKIGLTAQAIQDAGTALSRYPDEHIGKYPYTPGSYANILAVLHKMFHGRFSSKAVLEIGNRGSGFQQELHRRGAVPYAMDVENVPTHPVVRFEQGDLRNLRDHFRNRRFDAVVLRGLLESGSGLGRMSDEDQHAFFSALAEKINPGGIVLIEHFHAGGSIVDEPGLAEHGFHVHPPMLIDTPFGRDLKGEGNVPILWVAERKPKPK